MVNECDLRSMLKVTGVFYENIFKCGMWSKFLLINLMKSGNIYIFYIIFVYKCPHIHANGGSGCVYNLGCSMFNPCSVITFEVKVNHVLDMPIVVQLSSS